ncbi:MAG: hypothetical protein QM802_20100 [Agriterribacter sp.]
MEELQLSLPSFNGNEIIIREGAAVPHKDPEKMNISGDINTVTAFVTKRKPVTEGYQYLDPNKVIVTVDNGKRCIKIDLDPHNPHVAKLTATLEISDELQKFGINTSKQYKREELVKLIKFNRLDFDDADEHSKILAAYMGFNAKAFIEMKQEADQRGNKAQNFVKTVDTNIPNLFILNIPIFKGQESQRFRVEICLDVTDGGAYFWLESVELNEIMKTQQAIIFAEQLKCCQDYVIVNV